MSSKVKAQVTTALAAAIVIALVSIVLPKFILNGAIAKISLTQGLELTLSLLAIVVLGKRRFAEYGFRLPKKESPSSHGQLRWLSLSSVALLLGMTATIVVIASGASGSPVARQLSLPQMILFVWLFSSIIEEVFTRGFIQGHLSVLSGRYVKLLFFRVELPVFISAFFFACMHLVLPFVGADTVTTVVIWLFTFSLGLLAGHLRAGTGSLIPAVTAHMLANIGGLVGGIIYNIISFIISGKVPGN
ncbi:MAG: CPBP family intramembrane metalloprotease [candidate division Zixibacteria bacterium]|nr:CPBP family intramembrane metalloprotease [candidate division Zixibacteria bacterium]